MNINNMKVGEVRAIERLGIDIICVEGNNCEKCVFQYASGCMNADSIAGECMAEGREDDKEIYFSECKDQI